MNAWEANGYIVRYWIPRVPSEATKGKIKRFNKRQKSKRLIRSRDLMREKIAFWILLFVVLCRSCASLVSNLFLFFLHHLPSCVRTHNLFIPPLARLSRQWYFHCATVPLRWWGVKLAYKGVLRLWLGVLAWGSDKGDGGEGWGFPRIKGAARRMNNRIKEQER